MTGTGATAIGFVAVLLWALLALFTVGSAPVPPFQLNAICFTIGSLVGFIWLAWSKGGISRLYGISFRVWALGIAGLFGYHALYFSALRMAPAAEAGLIAYLWPLFIVLFSGLLPGERLRAGHIAGGFLGFAGAALIMSGGAEGFEADALPGYGLALLCALVWSGYSVLSRRAGGTPTESVTVFCAAAAVLSVIAHLLFETTAWPRGALGWASTLALGIGPVGLAFYVWDIGVKHGNIQMLGVASYAAPLLSTLALAAANVTTLTWPLAGAGALIVTGAGLAAWTSMTPG